MKFIYIFLSVFNLTFFANVKLEDFQDNIHQGYEYYETLIEESNQYYTLNITWGINKNNINYSLYFYSDKPQNLQIRVIRNNYPYTLPADSRGDVVIDSFKVSNPRTLQLVVIDGNNNIYRSVDLPVAANKAGFLELAEYQLGENKGLKTTNLQQVRTPGKILLLMIGLFIIIFISSIIILILFLRKKGLFNNQKEEQQQHTYWIYRQYGHGPNDDNGQTLEDSKTFQELFLEQKNAQETSIEEEPKQVYKRSLRYDDEEQQEEFNIKNHLQEKGYITSYHLLIEEEKNLIMVELMILRDQKLISLEAYKQEVIELWKEF